MEPIFVNVVGGVVLIATAAAAAVVVCIHCATQCKCFGEQNCALWQLVRSHLSHPLAGAASQHQKTFEMSKNAASNYPTKISAKDAEGLSCRSPLLAPIMTIMNESTQKWARRDIQPSWCNKCRTGHPRDCRLAQDSKEKLRIRHWKKMKSKYLFRLSRTLG